MTFYEETMGALKKVISITINGKPIHKVYGNPEEVKWFFNSVEDKDEQIVTSFFDGEDVIEHKSTGMLKAMGSYGENVGKSFRDLQKSLATRDAHVHDAHTARCAGAEDSSVEDSGAEDSSAEDSSAEDYPSVSSVESYQDRFSKSLHKISSAQHESDATDTTTTGKVEYSSLSSASSYDEKLGKPFRDLQMKLSGRSISPALEKPLAAVEAPPSPRSVLGSLDGVNTAM